MVGCCKSNTGTDRLPTKIEYLRIGFENTKEVYIQINGTGIYDLYYGDLRMAVLEKLPWFKKLIKIRQRIIDPAILFCDWKNDETLPNLQECKNRGKIGGVVTHNALEDAWDVIELLRTKY